MRGKPVPGAALAVLLLSGACLLSACATAPARGAALPAMAEAAAIDASAGEAAATRAAEEAAAAKEAASAAARATARSSLTGKALVVMDMQKGYMPIWRSEEVFANIARLVEAARAAGSTVIWVYTQEGQSAEDFAVAPPLAPEEGEPRVVKINESAFAGTGLEDLLDARGVGTLVVCGLASNQCVSTTVWVALEKGYRVTVARDAHSSPQFFSREKVIEIQNGAWTAGGRVNLVPAAEVNFAR